ncbi:hypothetical protein QTO34_008622 [Cnephaeus nilssonii]|uniref:60S ribosome subunit biogenesis protein NIP7 homolog n=1 Tax=Cnephaeus nilssonii TaxID=3371016 RepID=A0AA40HG97_CNENI|nr:hypothetical protein QTO34_008622 [Eptesicus nilssonii]
MVDGRRGHGGQGRGGAEPEVTGGGDADPAANAGRDEQGAGRAFTVPRGPAPERRKVRGCTYLCVLVRLGTWARVCAGAGGEDKGGPSSSGLPSRSREPRSSGLGLPSALEWLTSTGESLQLLVDRPQGTYCFRQHYVREKILKLAANISGDKRVSLGSCFGKFTKTHKFRLHITALDYLAPYAQYQVWIKPGAEQSFLKGNHVLKSGLGRITENPSQYPGVVGYSMADIPVGFGVAATSTQDCRKVDPMVIVVFHQVDIGEYVRHAETLT